MTLIFGKKRSFPSVCGVCAADFGHRGVSFFKNARDHQILWVCSACSVPEKWHRVFSMNYSKLDQIENICIQIASKSIIRDVVKIIFPNQKDEFIDRLTDQLKRDGKFADPCKKFMGEFSIELNKWI